MRFSVCSAGCMRHPVMAATGMTRVPATMPGTACTSRFALVAAAVLRLWAAATMANGLEVPETTASDHGPAIENGERYGCPYHGRPKMASDKSSWSDTKHCRGSHEATEI